MRKNDNREYDYSSQSESQRDEYSIIAELVQPGSKVLDLGCGDGALLKLLAEKRSCVGSGIELSPSGVEKTKAKGFEVREGRVDQPLTGIPDRAYDYAICNVTIQMVMYPETLLCEMGRIAKRQIISFPNFGHYRNRLEMLFSGRMPKTMLFGYEWYSTGHIHQLSASDFLDLARAQGFSVHSISVLSGSRSSWKRALARKFPNLLGVICIFELEKA